MRLPRSLLLVAACSLLAACSYKPSFINEYKIDVQQGNVLTQDMVAQLKPGQTREQVRFILGSPLIADSCRSIESRLAGEGRVLLRPSGTEPLLRVMVEGKDAAQVKACAEQLATAVREALD